MRDSHIPVSGSSYVSGSAGHPVKASYFLRCTHTTVTSSYKAALIQYVKISDYQVEHY